MKKTSPMQMRKSTPSGGKRMTAYAQKRNNALAKKPSLETSTPVPLASQMGRDVPHYDPQYDLDTLTRAASIKQDKKRHSSAMNEAKRRQASLKAVMGKD